jgi:hypothetical protein
VDLAVTNGGDGVGLYLGGGIVAPLACLALGIPLERQLFAPPTLTAGKW